MKNDRPFGLFGKPARQRLFVAVFAAACCARLWSEPASAPSAVSAALMIGDERLGELEKQEDRRSADKALELALAYDERGRTAEAIREYLQAAEAGVGAAELRLGWLCESGTGGDQSYSQARAHYERAIALAVPEASMRLGLLYLEGWGVTKDMASAVQNVRLAAEAGYQPAERVLAGMYFTGTGVTVDLKQALFWAEKSAARDDPAAETYAGSIYQKSARLPQDILSAREWYQLSCEQDYARGMLYMASTFLGQNANADNVRLGIRWLKLATEEGDGLAAFFLAGFQLWAPLFCTPPGDEETAREYLTQSAAAGENAASEVLQLESGWRSLADAFRYVMTTPFEDRYVQRLARELSTAAEVASGSVKPRPIKLVKPVYPAAMKLTQTDGDVLVEFIIDRTGRVRNAHAISSTHQAFTDSAIASVETWRFAPGYKNGHPVNTRTALPVQFRTSGFSGPPPAGEQLPNNQN